MDDSFYTLIITMLKAYTYFMDECPYSYFLEKWSYQGKDLYCIGTVCYYKNQNKYLSKIKYFKEFCRSIFYTKDEAEKEYNNWLENDKIKHPDNIQIFGFIDDNIFNVSREYYIRNMNLENDLWKDPYGNLNFPYIEFVNAYKEKFGNEIQN